MPPVVVDLVVMALILGMTYALASEGLWGAALMFFNTLFAGLIAFNFYEPLAALLAQNAEPVAPFADSICLLLIFGITLFVLRLMTDSFAPTMVRFPNVVYHIGRWFFGLAAATLCTSILLLGFHTAPIHKKMFFGAYPYDYKPPFKMGIDWQWLSFFQYTTGNVFANYSPNNPMDPFKEYGQARVFDPRGEWLIEHQNKRPFGEGLIPDPAAASQGAAGGADSTVAGGSASAGSPGIPGGTAGAAVGLAPTTP